MLRVLTVATAAAVLVTFGLMGPSAAGGNLYQRSFSPPYVAPPGQELVVSGHNASNENIVLVVRLDDGRSRDYGSRVNEERVLPPGRFVLSFPLGTLRTPSGRRLDSADIRRLIVFTPAGAATPSLGSVTFETGFSLPRDSHGWDFGPSDGAIFPGFEAVVPGDPRISGGHPRALDRPVADALIGDGIRGMTGFRTAWPDGAWRVTLWTEDLGEWEYLPHFLERRIRVNGYTATAIRSTPRAWIESVYLAGRGGEAIIDGDPWALFGSRRGGRVTVDVEVRGGELRIDLAGDSPAATYLAAVLIEPVDGPSRFASVETARGRRFAETWRTAEARNGAPPRVLEILPIRFGTPIRPGRRPQNPGPEILAAATGSDVILDYLVLSPDEAPKPEIVIRPPRRSGVELAAILRAGHWRFERSGPASTLLVATADHLRGDARALGLAPSVPRRYTIRVRIPAGVPPGRYKGAIEVSTSTSSAKAAITIDVLDVRLPPADRRIGVYLERAPHLEWFTGLRAERSANLRCDLRFLRGLGLSGLAPPLATPNRRGLEAFVADMASVRRAGFELPVLAYAAVKRLGADGSTAEIGILLRQATDRLREAGLEAPIWAIADEPGNSGRPSRDLAALAAAIKYASPNAKVAAQLNNPRDREYLGALDVALVNPGYGVDLDAIDELRRHGVTPWFYNMPKPRLAAGFYLWRVGAAGYLQWHARMPTADPFDPTDGRESDVQLLFPRAEACPGVPDVHADLFALAEGVLDLRWLLWLESQARVRPAARRLLDALRNEIPTTWREADSLGFEAAIHWRRRITELARRLPSRSPDPSPLSGGEQ